MATTLNLEILIDAYDAFVRDDTSAKLESRLLDAAINAGMAYDEPLLTEWVAGTLGGWLFSDRIYPVGDVRNTHAISAAMGL